MRYKRNDIIALENEIMATITLSADIRAHGGFSVSNGLDWHFDILPQG